MDIILEILFVFLLFALNGKHTKCFLLLISLQTVSFFLQFLVGNSCKYSTFYTFFNILFVNLNLFLIMGPWRYGNLKVIYMKNEDYVLFFKKCLYAILAVNIILNSAILFIVLIYIPDIAAFKAEKAFHDLYDSIPYFANVFRYAYTSQNLGFFAIPFFFYYLQKRELKKAGLALFFSGSTLISAFAFYSRALILTYVLVFLGYYLLINSAIDDKLRKKISSVAKKIFLIIGCLFIVITVVRFSAMDYYADRIPENSVIKNPILYSLVDYASQGYPNGLNLLEEYSDERNLEGEDMFRTIYQFLDFFHIISWDSEESKEKIAAAYNYDGGAFHGYTCQMVFNFGYILTLLVSVFYYFFVRHKLRGNTSVSLLELCLLILFLVMPLVAIFYSGLGLLYFSVMFMIFTKFLYVLKRIFTVSYKS